MRIVLCSSQAAQLIEPDDFRNFAVEIGEDCRANLTDKIAEIGTLDGDSHVWVRPIDLIRISPKKEDDAWNANLSDMLDYAETRGWLGPNGTVRAHIIYVEG